MISALFLYIPMLLSGFEHRFVHRKIPVFLADFSAKRIRTVFTDFPCLLMIFPKLLINPLFRLPAAEQERLPVQGILSAAREAVLR